ncbi:hypothetical protein HRbin11_02178 [bacterium HR11]|nr:hypothetical protein HRbin11_02178 [bacterium HR11]
MKKGRFVGWLWGFGVVLAAGACRRENLTMPMIPARPPRFEIRYPLNYPANLVGDGTILSIEGALEGAVPVQRPEDVVDRFELIIDGRRVGIFAPSQVVDEAFCTELGLVGCKGWPLLIDVREFGAPGRGKRLVLRAWKGSLMTEVALEFHYDNADLQQKALEFIRTRMVGTNPEKWNPEYRTHRMSDVTIYYKNEIPYYRDLIRRTLEDFVSKWTGLRFIETDREDVRPLIIYPHNGICCGATPKGENPANPYEITLALLSVDKGRLPPKLQLDDLAIIAHETGHAIGLPHTECVNGDHDFMADRCPYSKASGLHLHPYQQMAVKMVYSKPPGYSWR